MAIAIHVKEKTPLAFENISNVELLVTFVLTRLGMLLVILFGIAIAIVLIVNTTVFTVATREKDVLVEYLL